SCELDPISSLPPGRGQVGEGGRTGGGWVQEPLDDVVYLPPVAPESTVALEEIARGHLAVGTPILVQKQAGRAGARSPPGAVCAIDPLGALLAGDLGALDRLPEGVNAVVWPLVAGLTDDPALWEEGCARLARAGATVVQALALDLYPADRRRLVEAC